MKALLAPGMQTGKMKKFMTTLARTHLEVIIMLAVRENLTMIEVSVGVVDASVSHLKYTRNIFSLHFNINKKLF